MTSITSTPVSVIPVRRHVTEYGANYYDNKFVLFNIPKRVFAWLYSISFVLLLVLGLLFVAVTPIDVIVQTGGSYLSWLKMLIVIIVWVAFLVVSLIFYFSRLLQFRTALNDIPSKSVYIPASGDYPTEVYGMIDGRLRQCVDIGVQGAPLSDRSIIINQNGLSPPGYVQSRNLSVLEEMGVSSVEEVAATNPATLLPPDSQYEDIIRSVGDRFVTQRYRVFTSVDLPNEYSFREICFYLQRLFNTDTKVDEIVELYEKFRFGKELIAAHELVEFMVKFDNLASECHSDYHHYKDQDELELRAQHLDRLDPGHHKGAVEESSVENLRFDNRYDETHFDTIYDYDDTDSLGHQSTNLHLGVPSTTSIRRMFNNDNSSSSMKSVIRSRLALSKHRSWTDDDGGSVIERNPSGVSIHRKYSGYVTDSEPSDEDN